MISSETRGQSMGGLVNYLCGPGRANEHEDARVIAGSEQLAVPYGQALTGSERRDLSGQLDWGRDEFGVVVPDGAVFHMALSNGPADADLSDAQWAQISQRVMTDLGFDDPAQAGCRWAAVRHGHSSAGNDHVHVAVSMVRDDGTKLSLWRYKKTLSASLGRIERDFGLTVIDGRKHGTGMPGYSAAEAQRAERQHRPEPDRLALARQVRAAAVTAKDEPEFVRRLRGAGLWVRHRVGPDEAVTGYAVALTPVGGAAPVWFGGGSLAKDLRLPALRQHWDGPPAPDAVWTAAAAAGKSGAGGRAPGPTPREDRQIDAPQWDQAHEVVAEIATHLQGVAVGDDATWALAARETSGVLAAWSARLETTPGPLAAAADALAYSAQTPEPLRRPAESPLRSLRGVALVAAQATVARGSGPSWVLLGAQLAALTGAIRAAQVARGEAQRAGLTARDATDRLTAVVKHWEVTPIAEVVPAGWFADDDLRARIAAANAVRRIPVSGPASLAEGAPTKPHREHSPDHDRGR